MRATNISKWIRFGFIAITFLFFLFFFTKMYPIVISTTDDYYAFANHRHVLPEWRGSEPARVFPEVFMPLASQGAGLLFRIFGGNILDWLTFSWAVWTAAAVTGLVAMLYHLFRKRGVSDLLICAGLVVFLLMHFWIFKQRGQDGSIYMLHTEYACTYFHYVIPNLMNAILALWLYLDRDIHELFKPGKYLKKALFVFYAYISIFSNLWGSMILGAYLGATLLIGLVNGFRKKVGLRNWIKEHYVLLLLTVVWFAAQLFDLSGARAAAVGQDFAATLGRVWNAMLDTARKVNLRYALFCGLLIVGGLVSFFMRKDKKSLGFIGKLALMLVLTVAYLLLSCSKTGEKYVIRPDVFYGAFFFGAVIVMLCFFELLRRFPVGKLILPLLLLFILVDCNSMGRTYKDSITDYRGETVETHNRINQDILAQLQEAETAGKKETVIYIPDYNNADNWPYSKFSEEQIAKGFYKLGALKEEVVITEIIPDSRKNIELGVN